MTNRLLYLLMLIFAYSCAGSSRKNVDDVPPGKVRIRVSDREIDRRDLDAVLLPAKWWVDPHSPASQYALESKKLGKEILQLNAMVTYLEDSRKEGHYHFFSTTPPAIAEEALRGFTAAGLDDYTQVLRSAMDKAKETALEEVDFEEEDVRLLDLAENKDPFPEIWKYIARNRKAYYYEELVNKPE